MAISVVCGLAGAVITLIKTARCAKKKKDVTDQLDSRNDQQQTASYIVAL